MAEEEEDSAKKSRVTDVEKYTRVRQVQESILRGENLTDIRAKMVEDWKISERQAYRYIEDAFEFFKEQVVDDIQAKRNFHIAARMKIYREAMKKNNFKLALEVLNSLAKVQGVLITKIDHTSNGKDIKLTSAVVIIPDNGRGSNNETKDN